MSERPLKTLKDFPTSKLNTTPAVMLNGWLSSANVGIGGCESTI
jgi:hypothetical protein